MKNKMTPEERMAQLQGLQKESNKTIESVRNVVQSKTQNINEYNAQLQDLPHSHYTTTHHNVHDEHKVEKIGHTKGSCEIL